LKLNARKTVNARLEKYVKTTTVFPYRNHVTVTPHVILAKFAMMAIASLVVEETRIAHTTRHVSTANASTHVPFKQLVVKMQTVNQCFTDLDVDACIIMLEIHMIIANLFQKHDHPNAQRMVTVNLA